jgi:protein disulfide-isomerase A6
LMLATTIFSFLAAGVATVAALAQVQPIDLTPETFDRTVNGHRIALVQFFAPWCGHCRAMEPAMAQLATFFANDDRVIIGRVDGDASPKLVQRFGINGYPTIKFFPLGNDPQAEEVEVGRDFESLRDFVKARLGSKGKDRLPQLQPESAVTRLDDTSFSSIALDPQRAALVEFYAPWCEHCKTLEPIYEQLARIFRNEPSVVIAAIDCDANKAAADRYGIQGFPTIKFFDRGSKVPITYDGARTLPEMVRFLNQRLGTKRLANGDVSRDFGTSPEFDQKLTNFFKTPALRNNVINDADIEAQKSRDPSHAYYVFLMRRIREDGSEWIGPEIRRINAILESCQVDTPRADNYRVRRNILYRAVEIGKLQVGAGTLEL